MLGQKRFHLVSNVLSTDIVTISTSMGILHKNFDLISMRKYVKDIVNFLRSMDIRFDIVDPKQYQTNHPLSQ